MTGSAGIVGQYAIQLGRHEGLTVIGDAKPEDVALIESFGAHHVVPRGEAMAAAVRDLYPSGVDAVIDAALLGPPSSARSATAASSSPSARSRVRTRPSGTSPSTSSSSASTCTRATGSPSSPTWSPRAC